jgi:nitric oxide dioxygenase
MATLQEGFGPAFTPALREAWAIAYGALSGAMIDATRRTLADAA